MSEFSLPFHPGKKSEGRFDGGNLTSDAGLLVLYALDQQQGLSRGLAGCLQNGRDSRYVRHSFQEMIGQRVHQIAAGYETATMRTRYARIRFSRRCASAIRKRIRTWPRSRPSRGRKTG